MMIASSGRGGVADRMGGGTPGSDRDRPSSSSAPQRPSPSTSGVTDPNYIRKLASQGQNNSAGLILSAFQKVKDL